MSSIISRLFGSAHSGPSLRARAHVGVYRRGAQLIIAGDDETEAGFWIATDRIATLPASAPVQQVGEAVRAALDAGLVGVPTPTFGNGAPPLDAPLWRAAGVRSRRAFMTGARLCLVARTGAELTVTATHNGGSAGEGRGWSPAAASPRVVAADVAAAQLGEMVLAALDECTIAQGARGTG